MDHNFVTIYSSLFWALGCCDNLKVDWCGKMWNRGDWAGELTSSVMLDLPALIFICFSDDYWLKLCLNRQKSVTCFTVTHNSKFENQIKRDFQHWHFMSSSRRLCRCWDQNKSFEPLNFQPGTIKFSSRLIRKVHLVKECFFMYSFWNFCSCKLITYSVGWYILRHWNAVFF